MAEWDPERALSREEFEVALHKGLGRCVLQLQRFGTSGLLEIVRSSYFKNLAYDTQLEYERGNYTADLAIAAGDLDHLIKVSSEVGGSDSTDADGGHALNTLVALAKRGNAQARAAFDAIFDRFARRGIDQCSIRIVDLDGLPGLLRVARSLGGAAFSPEDLWLPSRLLDDAGERAGAREAEAALRAAAATDPNTASFLAMIDRFRGTPPEPDTREAPPPTYIALCERADAMRRERADRIDIHSLGWSWGKQASDAELHLAAADLLTTEDEGRLRLLIAVFTYREYPLNIDPLLDRARSGGEPVRHRVLQVLKRITDERIRLLALELLESGVVNWRVLDLLKLNYQAGDVEAIQRALDAHPPQTPDDIHYCAMAVEDICGGDDSVSCERLMLWAYESTPCSFCRERIVKALLEVGQLPAALALECRWDALPETRALVSDL